MINNFFLFLERIDDPIDDDAQSTGSKKAAGNAGAGGRARAVSDKGESSLKSESSKGSNLKLSPSLPLDTKSNFGKQIIEKESKIKVDKITNENEELVVSEEENDG